MSHYWKHRDWDSVKARCLKDLREVVAQLGHLPTKREYRRLRTTHMQSTESIITHCGYKWSEALRYIQEEPTLDASSQVSFEDYSAYSANPTESTEKASFAEAGLEYVVSKLPSYRLVSLLNYDCKINIDGLEAEAPQDNPSVVVKLQKSFTPIEPGRCGESCKSKLVLKDSGRELDFPAPEPGVIYLIDSSLYEAIPFYERRKDLLPVYVSEYFEAIPPGLYVGVNP